MNNVQTSPALVSTSSSDGQIDYLAASASDARLDKPLTRREAALLLGVSLSTVNRYMNDGLLKKITITPHTVRISRQSVVHLLTGTGQAEQA